MLHVGPEAVFTRETLTDTRIEALLDELRNADRIPDLHGVHIAVVGAGLDPKAGITAAREAGLETFWRAYFNEAGAEIVVWQPNIYDLPS
jgi:hypothetical protein